MPNGCPLRIYNRHIDIVYFDLVAFFGFLLLAHDLSLPPKPRRACYRSPGPAARARSSSPLYRESSRSRWIILPGPGRGHRAAGSILTLSEPHAGRVAIGELDAGGL